MTPESFHEIAEASGDVLANALLSSEADRLGGYVLGLNGCSSGRLERQALELMAYSVAVAQAAHNDYHALARYIGSQFMGRLDDGVGNYR